MNIYLDIDPIAVVTLLSSLHRC